MNNGSKIYSTWTFNSTDTNYFNSSLSGYNIGNRWNNMTSCSTNQTRGTYVICTNPNNYTINSTLNIYDYAPIIGIDNSSSNNNINNLNSIFPASKSNSLIITLILLISYFIFN